MSDNNLTKAEFEELFSDDISVKRQNILRAKAEERVDYIVSKTLELVGLKPDWYDYDNGSTHDEVNGFLDLEHYSETIEIEGEFTDNDPKNKSGLEKYGTITSTHFPDFNLDRNGTLSIPTTWLHQNFESAVKEGFQQYQEAEALKKQKALSHAEEQKSLKKRAKDLNKSIRSKLTADELKVIKFKF